MKRFDFLKSKNIDELVDWLDEYCMVGDCPWDKYFDDNYCSKCDAVEHEGHEYAWCELNKKCKFFEDMSDIPDYKQIIRLWLESEV